MKAYLFSFLLLVSGATSAQSNFFDNGNTFAVKADTFLPVEQAYQSLLSWQQDTLLIQWTMAEGYYLYRDRFGVSAEVDGNTLPVTVTFEPGVEKHDDYFGLTEVYYFNTTLNVSGLPRKSDFSLTVRSQGCADAGLCYPPQLQHYNYHADTGSFSQTRAEAAPPVQQSTPVSALPQPSTDRSLLWVLLLSLAGGAILNLMPCVFPVLSLKVLSFANAHHGRTAAHGLVYSLGVVLSFVAVAALLIALQQAGDAVGWGFQLQQPGFVAVMASLFFLMSLNLFGVFEFAGRWMNAGNALTRSGGYNGSFFTGVLATLVASPCTAPFMGTAVGYAASQPPLTALLVFAFLGAGMALPVLLLSIFPRWLRLLPKPGAWMNHLRQLLAFPLLASAIWLLWVYGRQIGANGMALLLITWLLLGLTLWLWRFGRKGRVLAPVAAALALYTAVVSGRAVTPASASGSFDPGQITELQAQGKNVFLDVTADWCITCAANERLVLNTDDVQQAFARANVHYLVADWTRYDPAITALLADFQRNGIPLYVYFPADTRQPAIVLPQILNKSLVLDLLPE